MTDPAKTWPQLDVIAVGAHPDDVEIACGGTLARLVEQGLNVGIIDLTNGEPTPLCEDPAIRLAEAAAAATALGVGTRVTLKLANRRLFDSHEARLALATEFRKYRPRLVIGFGDRTPMASPDHWQAMQITDAAIFYSRLCKWDDQFEDLPVHRIEAQLHYSIAFASLQLPPAAGHFVQDISETLEKKMASIACYKTQFPEDKAHVLDRVRAAAHYFGSTAGYRAGELLLSPRTIGTDNLMQTIFGDA